MTTELLPLEKYRELLDISPICTVDILFFNNDKSEVLLFKRENEPMKGTYYSAGGRLSKGEKLADCAIRQASREVGVTLRKDEIVFGGVTEEYFPNSIFEGVSYHPINIFFGCVLTQKELHLDSQHSDYKWFSVSDATIHPFIQNKIAQLLTAYGKNI